MTFDKQEKLREIARALTELDDGTPREDFNNAEIGEDYFVVQVNPGNEPSYDVKVSVEITDERNITSVEEPTA